MKIRRLLFVAATVCSLTACSSTPPATSSRPVDSAQILLEKGKAALAAKDYSVAEKYFQDIDNYYFDQGNTRFRKQALLLEVYSYFITKDYEMANIKGKNFIDFYGHCSLKENCQPLLDYVHYIKGLSSYEDSLGFLQRYLPANLAERRIKGWTEAFADFKQVSAGSPYYRDARQHMIFISNLFAEHELKVAEFDYNHLQYVGAINRAQDVIENSPGSPSVGGALAVLEKAYTKLGMTESADAVEKIIQENQANL